MRKPSAFKASLNEFHLEFGRTLAEWADLEHELSGMFCAVTGMGRYLSDAIFYSGRSFGTRADMLLAALTKARLKADERDFDRAAVMKAIRYNTFRNSLAHYQVVFYANEGPRAVKGDNWGLEGAYSVVQIRQAGVNFRSLKNIIFDVSVGDVTLEEGLARVLRLPKLAYSSEETPMPIARKPRQKPSQA